MASPLREARIDVAAITANVAALRALVAPADVMVVVKADGYGHGAEIAARAALAGGAARLGVADIDEALRLRAAGVDAPLLAWLHGPDADFARAAAADVEVGVSSLAQLDAATTAGAGVHLKVDTGLSRNGFAPDDAPAAFARAAARGTRVGGVFSHLANTSPDEDARQIAAFESALAAARDAGVEPGIRHLAATQAAISTPAARYDMVRIGIGAYGLTPGGGIDPAALGLRPAMELAAPVVAVRRVPAGTGVSYGSTHRTERPTTLALVPLGYADGVPRAASGAGAEVLVAGSRHPVVGRIAMDQLVVDVGDAAVAVGDRAVLWGDPATGAPSAEEWAAWAGTIGYEIVTRLGPRVARTAAT